MTKAILIICALIVVAALLYHFAALKIFNFVISKDEASQLRAANIAYGPSPNQKLDIYEPKNATGNLPILIFVHGGSWAKANQNDYEFVGRTFAARGFLTLVISYRGLPDGAYPDFIFDVAEATKWATHNGATYGGDGSTIFLVGHSAGAYNVALATLDTHYFRVVGVDPAIIKGVATLAGPFDFLPLDSPATIKTFGHLKDLTSTQPITFARADAPPFLLLYGLKDKTVFPKNSRSLREHLVAKGAKATLIEYDDLTHVDILTSLAKPFRKTAPVLNDIEKFFKDILQQAPKPDHSD